MSAGSPRHHGSGSGGGGRGGVGFHRAAAGQGSDGDRARTIGRRTSIMGQQCGYRSGSICRSINPKVPKLVPPTMEKNGSGLRLSAAGGKATHSSFVSTGCCLRRHRRRPRGTVASARLCMSVETQVFADLAEGGCFFLTVVCIVDWL